jgi:glycosyltransferase involved in cell wall biosynthesis
MKNESLSNDPTLLVSYLFPPAGGVGVQRALSYARYLPELGCPVHVLAASNPATPWWDPGLLEGIPSSVQVHRTFTPELPYDLRSKIWGKLAPAQPPPASLAATAPTSNGSSSSNPLKNGLRSLAQRAFNPDPQTHWRHTAIRRGAQVIREAGIRNILVTSPPFSSLRVGIALKKRFPHVRLISEFRDEWLNYYMSTDKGISTFRREAAHKLERLTIETSDFVVTVTPAWIEAIRSRYPAQPASKFLCIPNGYDPHTFRDFRNRPHGTGKLVITYTGTVYATTIYSPKPLLDAIDSLPEEIRSRIELRFAGRVVDSMIPLLNSCRCTVKQYGFLPQSEAFRLLEETDCVLLVVNNQSAQAGKLFEYFGTGKPILALSPPGGEVARMIAETKAGICVDPDNPGEIRDMLLRAFHAGDQLPAPDPARTGRYQRPNLIAQLAEAAGMGIYSGGKVALAR